MDKNILLSVMQYCRNHFISNRISGNIVLNNNKLIITGINTDIARKGQYIIIVGSMLNNPMYKIVDIFNNTIELDATLEPEEFRGEVYLLDIPASFLLLCKRIEAWQKDNNSENIGNIASEHFGDYSVSYKGSADGGAYTWQDEFGGLLRNYRKMFMDIWV